tara:strand:- start:1289 stop:1687 length:399 start_codon:yes stop_codon:yes gene_type:complete
MDTKIIFTPDSYFKNKENYLELWYVMREQDVSSRDFADHCTLMMSQASRQYDLSNFMIPHWHHITSEIDDGRSIRNYQKADQTGMRPVYQSRNFDFLRYLDVIAQSISKEYRIHHEGWRLSQIYCFDERDED